MAAQANIVAFDGAATPVSHTFTGVGVRSVDGEDVAMYRETSLIAVPTMAQPGVVLAKRILKSGVERVAVTVSVPVMESIGSQNASGYTAPPKVAYVNTVSAVGYFSQRATPAERRLVKQLLTNIMNNLATTTPGISAGPAAELVDSSVVPS